jgi:hypothetical protein
MNRLEMRQVLFPLILAFSLGEKESAGKPADSCTQPSPIQRWVLFASRRISLPLPKGEGMGRGNAQVKKKTLQKRADAGAGHSPVG